MSVMLQALLVLQSDHYDYDFFFLIILFLGGFAGFHCCTGFSLVQPVGAPL